MPASRRFFQEILMLSSEAISSIYQVAISAITNDVTINSEITLTAMVLNRTDNARETLNGQLPIACT